MEHLFPLFFGNLLTFLSLSFTLNSKKVLPFIILLFLFLLLFLSQHLIILLLLPLLLLLDPLLFLLLFLLLLFFSPLLIQHMLQCLPLLLFKSSLLLLPQLSPPILQGYTWLLLLGLGWWGWRGRGLLGPTWGCGCGCLFWYLLSRWYLLLGIFSIVLLEF